MVYRFHTIRPHRFHASISEHHCHTDVDAMMHAGELVESDHSVEVWQGSRFVGEIGRRFSRWSKSATLECSPALASH